MNLDIVYFPAHFLPQSVLESWNRGNFLVKPSKILGLRFIGLVASSPSEKWPRSHISTRKVKFCENLIHSLKLNEALPVDGWCHNLNSRQICFLSAVCFKTVQNALRVNAPLSPCEVGRVSWLRLDHVWNVVPTSRTQLWSMQHKATGNEVASH